MFQAGTATTFVSAIELCRPSLRIKVSDSAPADLEVQSFSVADAFRRFGSELQRLANFQPNLEALEHRTTLWAIAKGWRAHVFVMSRGERLEAAFFLRERLILGVPTGYFVGGDHMGETCLLCEPSQRRHHLRWFVERILQRQAFAVHLQSDEPHSLSIRATDLREGCAMSCARIASRWRHQLGASFDDSLAQFGKRTRRNLRHSLRVSTQNDWEFVPSLTEEELQLSAAQIDRCATYPASQEVLNARAGLRARLPGFFSAGLKAPTGEWLSTISGVRSDDGVTRVLWQHNTSLVNHSLCTVMRALMIEEEVKRATRRIEYVSGTNNLMEHYCHEEPSTRTIFLKRDWRLRIFKLLLRSPVVPPQNVLKAELQAGGL